MTHLRSQRTEARVLGALTAALALCALLATSTASPQSANAPIATDTPTATVESLNRGLVAIASDRANATVAARYRALEPLVEQTHDLAYIAEFALRRQWPMLTEEQRTRFVAAFEKLSVTTYATRFANVTADTFNLSAGAVAPGATPAEGRTEVRVAIARPGQADLPLEYLLQQKDGAWRIINIVADGVSDLALKRAEYQRVLANGTIDDLIAHVESQTAQLERK